MAGRSSRNRRAHGIASGGAALGVMYAETRNKRL